MALSERVQRLIDRIESRLSLATMVGGGWIVSATGVTVWFAQASEWLEKYGPYGWWIASLLGIMLAVGIICGIAWLRLKWGTASAIHRWSQAVDTINPLDHSFTGRRIRLSDLAHPVTNRIENKTFINCELMGPATIAVLNGTWQHGRFIDCDMVALYEDVQVFNAIQFHDVNVVGGLIYGVTIYLNGHQAQDFLRNGVRFLNQADVIRRMTTPAAGTPQPQAFAPETQP